MGPFFDSRPGTPETAKTALRSLAVWNQVGFSEPETRKRKRCAGRCWMSGRKGRPAGTTEALEGFPRGVGALLVIGEPEVGAGDSQKNLKFEGRKS